MPNACCLKNWRTGQCNCDADAPVDRGTSPCTPDMLLSSVCVYGTLCCANYLHPELSGDQCCPKYYECFECDRLFCEHGYYEPLPGTKVTVIPMTEMCPDCVQRMEDGE